MPEAKYFFNRRNIFYYILLPTLCFFIVQVNISEKQIIYMECSGESYGEISDTFYDRYGYYNIPFEVDGDGDIITAKFYKLNQLKEKIEITDLIDKFSNAVYKKDYYKIDNKSLDKPIGNCQSLSILFINSLEDIIQKKRFIFDEDNKHIYVEYELQGEVYIADPSKKIFRNANPLETREFYKNFE